MVWLDAFRTAQGQRLKRPPRVASSERTFAAIYRSDASSSELRKGWMSGNKTDSASSESTTRERPFPALRTDRKTVCCSSVKENSAQSFISVFFDRPEEEERDLPTRV